MPTDPITLKKRIPPELTWEIILEAERIIQSDTTFIYFYCLSVCLSVCQWSQCSADLDPFFMSEKCVIRYAWVTTCQSRTAITFWSRNDLTINAKISWDPIAELSISARLISGSEAIYLLVLIIYLIQRCGKLSNWIFFNHGSPSFTLLIYDGKSVIYGIKNFWLVLNNM